MSRTKIYWLVDDGLPEHVAMMEAVPGVGNVGKLVIDSLVEKHPSRTIGWILHPDFPPHSTLDRRPVRSRREHPRARRRVRNPSAPGTSRTRGGNR